MDQFLNNNDTPSWRKVIFALWCVVIVFAIPIASRTSDLTTAGLSVQWRPPGSVYGVFWGALILCLLGSWVLVSGREPDDKNFVGLAVAYFLIVVSCVAWVQLYSRNKLYGIPAFLALLCVLACTIPIAISVSTFGGSLLLPLGVWTTFQLAVNCRELEGF